MKLPLRQTFGLWLARGQAEIKDLGAASTVGCQPDIKCLRRILLGLALHFQAFLQTDASLAITRTINNLEGWRVALTSNDCGLVSLLNHIDISLSRVQRFCDFHWNALARLETAVALGTALLAHRQALASVESLQPDQRGASISWRRANPLLFKLDASGGSRPPGALRVGKREFQGSWLTLPCWHTPHLDCAPRSTTALE